MPEQAEDRSVASHLDLLLQLVDHPGWKILQSRLVDLERLALADLSEVDLTTETGIRKGIQLQAQIDAIRAIPTIVTSAQAEAAQEEIVELAAVREDES